MQLLSSSISHILRVWGEGAHPDEGIPNMWLPPPPRSPRPPPVRLHSQGRLATLPPPPHLAPQPALRATRQGKMEMKEKKSPSLPFLGSRMCPCSSSQVLSPSQPCSGIPSPSVAGGNWHPAAQGWVLAQKGLGVLQRGPFSTSAMLTAPIIVPGPAQGSHHLPKLAATGT